MKKCVWLWRRVRDPPRDITRNGGPLWPSRQVMQWSWRPDGLPSESSTSIFTSAATAATQVTAASQGSPLKGSQRSPQPQGFVHHCVKFLDHHDKSRRDHNNESKITISYQTRSPRRFKDHFGKSGHHKRSGVAKNCHRNQKEGSLRRLWIPKSKFTVAVKQHDDAEVTTKTLKFPERPWSYQNDPKVTRTTLKLPQRLWIYQNDPEVTRTTRKLPPRPWSFLHNPEVSSTTVRLVQRSWSYQNDSEVTTTTLKLPERPWSYQNVPEVTRTTLKSTELPWSYHNDPKVTKTTYK